MRVILTEGNVADCKCALDLLKGLDIKVLLADRGYDTNEILNYAQKHHIKTVIPPKRNRKEQREYDEEIYQYRYKVEKAFLDLKGWRGINTRYAKNAASFLAAIHIRCIALALSNL